MTPLLPSPKHYLYNLITMTSPEAKKLWRKAIKEHFNCTCVYCGKNYERNELTIDHVTPRSKGGDSSLRNLVPACRKCNKDKGSKEWKAYMRQAHGVNPQREELIFNHIGLNEKT